MAIDTGHGANATVISSSLSWTSIDVGSFSIPSIDTTNLTTAGNSRRKIAGDMIDPGSCTFNCYYDAETDLPQPGSSGTVTINIPDGTGSHSNLSGTGFIESITYPTLETDTLQTASITVTWQDKPTFT